MVIKFENTFYKDLRKVSDKKTALDVKKAIAEFETANSIRDISNIKNLQDTNLLLEKEFVIIELDFLLKKIQ